LFKKVPSLDFFTPFLTANDDQVVITLRGIGEMESQNPNSRVTLTATPDEFLLPRAFVSINPSVKDNALWDAMDSTADDAALVFANGQPYEVLVDGAYQKGQCCSNCFQGYNLTFSSSIIFRNPTCETQFVSLQVATL
jgi:hypothetical protein